MQGEGNRDSDLPCGFTLISPLRMKVKQIKPSTMWFARQREDLPDSSYRCVNFTTPCDLQVRVARATSFQRVGPVGYSLQGSRHDSPQLERILLGGILSSGT